MKITKLMIIALLVISTTIGCSSTASPAQQPQTSQNEKIHQEIMDLASEASILQSRCEDEANKLLELLQNKEWDAADAQLKTLQKFTEGFIEVGTKFCNKAQGRVDENMKKILDMIPPLMDILRAKLTEYATLIAQGRQMSGD